MICITGSRNIAIFRLLPNGEQGLEVQNISLKFANMKKVNGNGYINGDGSFADYEKVFGVFDRQFGQWDNTTLAKEGTDTTKANSKVVFLPFAPSSENLSVYIFKTLKPLYNQMGVNLRNVYVKDTRLTAEYPCM